MNINEAIERTKRVYGNNHGYGLLVTKALTHMRDHKRSSVKDEEFVAWLEGEKRGMEKERGGPNERYDPYIKGYISATLDTIGKCLAFYANKKLPTNKDYFGAEF
jgi:hypothetical protein